jgi:succinate dehydrogenase / fumarate reductase, membrane anchor subunit
MSRNLKTPLGSVRGLGSARSGSEHFYMQRLTALALVPLALVFVAVLVSTIGKPAAQAAATLSNPFVAILMLLFVVAGAWHMRLGMQVIIEDYLHHEGLKIAAVVANTFFAIVVGVAAVFALLRIAL